MVGQIGDWLSSALGWLWQALGEALGGILDTLRWLKDLVDPTTDILVNLWPPLLAIIATVISVRIVRWGILRWRGRTPRVQVTAFEWATSDKSESEATWVTSLFREQLAALRLDALDPLPERAPGAPLVEIVEGVGHGVSKDIGTAVGRLFRAIWPDSAYEVWGTLRPREDGGRISVQLIERRGGNRTLLNVAMEEASWEDGARQAALAVAGALYQRVRPPYRGPWAQWKKGVPRELMDHYHAARFYEEENMLEHALDAYQTALDQDPLNPNLRLKIAMLQERLELYLDAWATYEAIVDEADRRVWKGPDRRVHLLALYRLAVMLSNGRIAAQWIKGASLAEGEGSRRDEERRERREELLRSLEERNSLIKLGKQGAPRLKRPSEIRPRRISRVVKRGPSHRLISLLRWIDPKSALHLLDPFKRVSGNEDVREQRIELLLQLLSLRRLEELEMAQRIRPPLFHKQDFREWWRRKFLLSRPELGRNAVRTSKLLVHTRVAASLESQAERAAGQGSIDPEPWIKAVRKAHRMLTKRWPFPPANPFRFVVHFIDPRRHLENRRDDSWQLHYNAACATASALRHEAVLARYEREEKRAALVGRPLKPRPLPGKSSRKDVAQRAIDQLEEYAFRAGGARVAGQADWVAIDDPDLQGLRDSDEFKIWARHHLPRAVSERRASLKADVKRFTIRTAQEGARALAVCWRERAMRPAPSAEEVVDWWLWEAKIWRALSQACREHLSWQERLKWLKTLEEWLRRNGMENKVEFSHEERGAAVANSMSQGLFDELVLLVGDGARGSEAGKAQTQKCVLDWLEQRIEHVRDAHQRGEVKAGAWGQLRRDEEREAALQAALAWDRLADVLKRELDGDCEEDSDEIVRGRLARVVEHLPDRSLDSQVPELLADPPVEARSR